MHSLPVEADWRKFLLADEQDVVNDTLNSLGIRLTASGLRLSLEFRYLPLHDVEAIWWIAANLLISHEPRVIGGKLAVLNANIDEQRRWSSKLFYDLRERTRAFGSPMSFGEEIEGVLHPDLEFVSETFIDHLKFVKDNLRAIEREVASTKQLKILQPEAYTELAERWSKLAKDPKCRNILMYHLDDCSSVWAVQKAIQDAGEFEEGREVKRPRLV